MIGLVYCAQAGLGRLCKMEVWRHLQSQVAHALNIENFIYYNCEMQK